MNQETARAAQRVGDEHPPVACAGNRGGWGVDKLDTSSYGDHRFRHMPSSFATTGSTPGVCVKTWVDTCRWSTSAEVTMDTKRSKCVDAAARTRKKCGEICQTCNVDYEYARL